ncbi:hypothetical protein FRC00_002852, partial [Tulasnella sp. 408]
MRNKESQPTGPASPPGSRHETAFHGFELSTKLRAKLKQLSPWRIHPSSIKSLEGAPEIQGGYAVVSRALLAVPPDAKEGLIDSHGRKGKPSAHASGSEGDRNFGKGKEGTRRGMMMKLKSMVGLVGPRGTGSSSLSNVAYKTVAVKKIKISENFARILRVNMARHDR